MRLVVRRQLGLARLALAGGRTDRLRIGLTVVGSAAATVVVLTAVSVIYISSSNGPYRLEVLAQPGLRPGVIVALLLLSVPLTIFIGLCTRVGGPARDRRLAIFRMAGATPGDATRIATFETGAAALLGAILGVAVHVVGRQLFSSTSISEFTTTMADGSTTTEVGPALLLPTDVDVPIPAVLAVVAVVAVAAMFASAFAMRKVRISPFGVTRRVPSAPPTRTAAALFVGGTGGLMALGVANQRLGSGLSTSVLTALSLALFAGCTAGLLMGSASLSFAVGQFVAPRVSRADALIAGRRMIDAPFTSSRAATSVLLAVLLGGAVLGTRANFLASQDPNDTFYADTFDLLNLVLAAAIVLSAANLVISTSEAVVERRRTLAALVAAGTPRAVLARAAMMETLIPLAPAVVLAAGAGVAISRTFFGDSVERLATFEVNGTGEVVTVAVPIPWMHLGVLTGGAITVSLAATAVSLLFLRSSTRPGELRTAA